MTDTQKNAAVEVVIEKCRPILKAVAASGRVEGIDLHNLRAALASLPVTEQSLAGEVVGWAVTEGNYRDFSFTEPTDKSLPWKPLYATPQPAPALDEKAIRHDERRKIIAQGCIHTRKAAEQNGSGDRPDIVQWQEDGKQWFDPTICEIVSEYAAWRDAQPAPVTGGGEVSACEACGRPCNEDSLHMDDNGFVACAAAFTEDGSGDCPHAALSHSAPEAQSEQPAGWQPIETAPKDETQILVEVRAGYFAVVSYWGGGWRETANGLLLRDPPLAWMPITRARKIGGNHHGS